MLCPFFLTTLFIDTSFCSIEKTLSELSRTNSTTASFAGYLDEVGIWGRHLTQTDVTLLYMGGGGNAYPFSEPFLVKQIKFALAGGYWDDTGTWVDESVWWED